MDIDRDGFIVAMRAQGFVDEQINGMLRGLGFQGITREADGLVVAKDIVEYIFAEATSAAPRKIKTIKEVRAFFAFLAGKYTPGSEPRDNFFINYFRENCVQMPHESPYWTDRSLAQLREKLTGA